MNSEDIIREIEKLKKNRLLRTRDEFFAFEEAIENLSEVTNPNIIRELCKCFDDHTEDEEVMFGIVHIIEDFEIEDALFEIAKAVPDMIERARKWVKILHYRILNYTVARRSYKKVLNSIDKKNKEVIIKVLDEISKEDNEKFAPYIDEVLN
ncbi:hypothetical protein DVW08_07715 [Clostridium botulinum]|uniref:Imm30 family immunity protein n=1 Tax=Clostridium sp. ZBS13 TaxID=2949971 RepID=UPI001D252DFA|nr:Imm30 family immunity protein [Clostridium sp. ZBS13]MBN1045254.1 hypothetical protein [Clostridium botulinum]